MHLDVKVDEDTVWLNRKQLALLFGRDIKTIGKHIGNALREEKAANLLYQVVKDHPFSDGNKRCAAALFVYFLNGNSILGDDDSPACGG